MIKLPQLQNNDKGAVPVLVVASVLGLLSFFLITNTFDFKSDVFSGLFAKPTSHASEIKPDSVPDQILVKYKSASSEKDKDDLLKLHSLEKKEEVKQIGVHVLKVNPQAKDQVLEVLKKSDKVEYAEEDFILKELDTPNDPAYPDQWNLAKINASGAWDISQGTSSAVVAVIDAGIHTPHEDFVGKITANGYNFVDGNTDVSDATGHGTAVSGLVGAATNNGLGIASLGRNVSLMPLRVVTTGGTYSVSKEIQALTYAADNGAKVINISLGGTGYSQAEQDAVNYAWGQGLVIVAAAGNDGTCCIFYPAADQNVIAVGSTDGFDNKAIFSSTGQGLDVMAPGVNVQTTNRSGTYGGYSGTSFSSPQVAALAGLIRSYNPALSNQQVVDIITSTIVDLGAAGWDDQFGFGRIDAAEALQRATEIVPGASPTPTPTPSDTTPPTASITTPANNGYVKQATNIAVKAKATDNVAVSKVEFYIDGALHSTDTTPPTPFTASWNTTGLATGTTHTIYAKSYDAAGNTKQSSTITVTVDGVKPTVSITSPANGALVPAGSSLTILANASDNLAMQNVVFTVFRGTTKLATLKDTTSPYSVNWTVPTGTGIVYTIKAQATDKAGNTSTLVQVNVTSN